MLFIIIMNPIFHYKHDGNIEYILVFGNINIRAQIYRFFADREKSYIIAVLAS